MNNDLRAIDLCCGAGGWAAAARGLPIRFLAVADIAADCLETWEINHSAEHPDCRLLRVDLSSPEGQTETLEAAGNRIDLILGGIPCEEISVARSAYNTAPLPQKKLDAFHRLVDGCLKIVTALKPKYWAIEDVIGIEKHLPLPLLHGEAVPYRRLRAEEFGPQARLRTFLGRFPDPQPKSSGPSILRDVLRPGPWRTIPNNKTYQRDHRQYYTRNKLRVWDPEKPGFTVLDWGGRHARGAMIEATGGNVRQLEWQEAAALQGFPEDYVFAASWTRTWKMVAQAIPIYVGRAILEAICGLRNS